MNLDKLALPKDFEEKLPELKQRTLKWQTVYNSGTEINSSATISFHEPLNGTHIGNLILIPALATNSKIDPLMKSITYWGLMHKYGILNIDTFLGDFERDISADDIKKYTYPEFKSIINQTFKFITPYTVKNTCIIGHCFSAAGIIDLFNDHVRTGEKIPVQSAILFAPWPKLLKQKYDALAIQYAKLSCEDPATDPTIRKKMQHIKFVLALQDLGKSIADVKFEPEIIDKWQIPVTFVAAGRDNVAPADRVQQNFEILRNMPNGRYFKYLYLPSAKHSFQNAYTDTTAIIKIIKSQRQK